ncbi:MAG: AI-2E family transporter [Pseudomonadota bacterium]
MGNAVNTYRVSDYIAVALAALILYLAYLIFIPFFVPVFWGGVLGALFHPVYARLNRRLGHRAGLSSMLLTSAVFLLVLIPALAMVFEIVREALELYQQARQAFGEPDGATAQSFLNSYVLPLAKSLGFTPTEVNEAVAYAVQRLGGLVVQLGPLVVGNLAVLGFQVFFTLVTLYYAFTDGPHFLERLKTLLPLPPAGSDRVAAELRQVISAALLSLLVVAVGQSLAAGLVFWALGLPLPLLWALAAGLASFIPALGAPLAWIPMGIYLLMTGDYFRAGVLAVAGAILIPVIDNVMRPLIVHGRVHINNFYVFFAMLGGVYLVGLSGLVFGPLMVALSFEVLKIYRERRGAPAEADDANG